MFIDSVLIYVKAGDGGEGSVSFRKEKYVLQGGPDGGDGGKGGDVIFQVDENTSTLSSFRGHKYYKASNGEAGAPRKCSGKKGKNLIIKVPKGVQVYKLNLDEKEFNLDKPTSINFKNIPLEDKDLLVDLISPNEKVTLFEGGLGGLGNVHFKSSTNQRPLYAQKGIKVKGCFLLLELKLIADIGLVGFPNAGKSSLISKLTNVRPKIANYEFTTLLPNIGVADVDEFSSFLIADIPGLIKGASSGKGLGNSFLKHIERTKLLLFVLDLARCFQEGINKEDISLESKLQEQLEMLLFELANHSDSLKNKPFAIIINKTDILQEELNSFLGKDISQDLYISKSLEDFRNLDIKSIDLKEPFFILKTSVASNINLTKLKNLLYELICLDKER